MVSVTTIKAANTSTLPASLPVGFTAVFIGGTSGIGNSALRQLAIATRDKSPRIYIIGRNAVAASPLIADLRQSNSSATFEFIEKDVSLLRDTTAAVEQIKAQETKIDLLFMSAGFLSFNGRNETVEGLDPTMTTRFYSRVRALELLTPLLNASANPHVTNILAGGHEGPLIEDDLDLAHKGNYGLNQASVHSATMLTLVLERFAKGNPNISFVHAFPGPTATPLLTRGSSGIISMLLKWLIVPILNTFVAASADDVGARSLFYATNARYTVEGTAALSNPVPEGLERAQQSAGGVFLVDSKSETIDNEAVLAKLRLSVANRVWDNYNEILERVNA
ncbi:hypothetical protein G7046_g1992 [Stylonectria norvegica]|nr:hypothetical protein G7046_g1992 [Stylonectria norvegica]